MPEYKTYHFDLMIEIPKEDKDTFDEIRHRAKQTCDFVGERVPKKVGKQIERIINHGDTMLPSSADGATIATFLGKRHFDFSHTDSQDVTYTPWTNGWAVGFKATHPDGRTEYIYLNPSSDSDDGVSTVFPYQGTEGIPGQDYGAGNEHYVMFGDTDAAINKED